MNIFEYAAKNKLRFTSSVGSLTVEDLYDLPLQSTKNVSLDSVAKAANNEIKSSQEESFVTTASPQNTVAQLKLDIVKHIIADRLEERDRARQAAENKQRREKIADIIADKQDDALKNMSLEELQAELAK